MLKILGWSKAHSKGEYSPVPLESLERNNWSRSSTSKDSILRNVLLYSLPAGLLSLFLLSLFRSTKAPLLPSVEHLQALSTNISSNQIEPALNRHLTAEQCEMVFPGLNKEAERSFAYWRERGGISEEHVMTGQEGIKDHGTRVLIWKNRMYIRHRDAGPGGRELAALGLINEALISSTEPLPDADFVIDTTDLGHGGVDAPLLALCRRPEAKQLFVMPDFGFGTWPEPGVNSFIEVRDKAEIVESRMSWQEKIPRLFWRGATWVNGIRPQLIAISDKNPAWGDVTNLDWAKEKDRIMTMDEHCKWKYLAHVEGSAYSGRFKYLTQCRSVMITHPLHYIQHYTHLLNSKPGSPQQNVIMTGQNFHGLETIMNKLLADDEYGERLANTSYAFWRHWLSPASTNCAWRAVIKNYAAAQTFKPEWRPGEDVSWASYTIMRKTSWTPS